MSLMSFHCTSSYKISRNFEREERTGDDRFDRGSEGVRDESQRELERREEEASDQVATTVM